MDLVEYKDKSEVDYVCKGYSCLSRCWLGVFKF